MVTEQNKITTRTSSTKQEKLKNPYIDLSNKVDVELRMVHLTKHNKRNQDKKNLTYINRNIYHLLLKPATYVNAWGNLRNNKGSLTPGVDVDTMQGFGLEKAKLIVNKLKEGTFKPNPVRRVWIPKPGKVQKRPLGIPTAEDRLVQEAIRGILEAIYEPEFSKYAETNKQKMSNYGFRPRQTIQQALENFKYYGQNIDWVIEGDIESAYDTVDHEILLKILSRRITDQKFLKLIKAYLEAGIMEDFHVKHSLTGVPQGGIASPILFNIYMFEFDKFVKQHLSSFLKRITKPDAKIKTNTLWKSYQYQALESIKKMRLIRKNRPIKQFTPEQKIEFEYHKKNHSKYRKLQLQTPSKLYGEKPFDLVYVRYADDWIIGISGPKAIAVYFRQKIKSFFHYYLKLKLSESQTKITHIKTDKIRFLGFELVIRIKDPKQERIPTKRKNLTTGKITTRLELRRTTSKKFKITPDKPRILDRMKLKGFLDTHGSPRAMPSWSVCEDYEIVNKYKQTFQGLVNYYSHCDNNNMLHYAEYIYLYSCAKTLAQRHRLTVGKVFKKYGKRLRAYLPPDEKGRIKFAEIPTETSLLSKYKTINFWENQTKIKSQITNPSDPFAVTTGWRSKYKIYKHCCFCGSSENIEMHHTRSVKSIKTNGETKFSHLMQQLNRRQIPLCHDCHVQVTYGKHNFPIKLTDLYDQFLAKL
jgi:group II intron reverse transcriptase/maturase